ncbi:hypothetical protein ACFXKC_14700 [Streptomyces sp. NPDC059340]|uniref:hypothetical protein n=1 Tax=Streptomyces sp. NPDC059340 TaxID=3346806 RepID=UPI0036C5AAB5
MHFLISRSRTVLLPPLAGAALVRGPVGTAAAAVDVRQEASAERDVVVERLDALDRVDHDAVFHPLLDALSAVAERGGRLDAAEAAGYARALETANASLERRLKERASATTSATTATTAAAPGATATTAAPAASGATAVTDRAGIAVADPVSDLLTQLQSTVDGLVKALTGALGTVTGLLSPVVGVVTGLLGGGLSGLPALPTAGSPAPSSR